MKINKDNLAYTYIKNKIINNEYKSEDILDEKIIAKTLKLSTTPIKNALKRLEKEQFIVIKPRKKTYVKKIDLKLIKDLFQMRIKLEYLLVDLTIENMKPELLKSNLKKFQKDFEKLKTNDGFDEIYNNFRNFFVINCGNMFLIQQMLVVYDHLFRLRKTLFRKTPRREDAILEQLDIIEHILTYNNSSRLKDKVNNHIKNAQIEFFNNLYNLKI